MWGGGTHGPLVSAVIDEVEEFADVAEELAGVVQLLDARDQRVDPRVDQLVRRIVIFCSKHSKNRLIRNFARDEDFNFDGTRKRSQLVKE